MAEALEVAAATAAARVRSPRPADWGSGAAEDGPNGQRERGGGDGGGGRSDGRWTGSCGGCRGTSGGATSQTSGLAHYDQDPSKILVQAGRQVARNVAPTIVCATKPTWNTKQRLVRQQECGHQDQSEVGFVDSARETNKARAVVEIYLNRGRYPLWACTLLIPLIENRRRRTL